MIKGILFDVDGTLVLSNDAHARAWEEAFAEYGYEVPFKAVRKLIGMGGDKLLSSVAPELNEDEGDGKAIKERRKQLFLEKYVSSLRPTPGCRELVEAVKQAGLKTMVASSASKDELGQLLKAADVDDLLTEATSSDEVDNSKPDPDIVKAALTKIGLQPNEVVMVGDTPYDIEAATKAGVLCIALRSGGWKDAELAGTLAIYNDPAELLAHRADFGY